MNDAVNKVLEVYKHSHDEWAEARERSRRCYEFALSEQWTDAERRVFENTGRPAMVYNMILPRLHNLLGTEQLNRRSTRIRPASGKDELQRHLANILGGLWLNIWEKEEGEFELEKAFLDGLIMTTPGWIGVDVVPNELGYLEYRIRSRNPMSIIPDPDYRDYKLRDCRWIISENWLTPEEIGETYNISQSDMALLVSSSERNFWERLGDRIKGLFNPGDDQSLFYNKDSGKYKVLEMQTRETAESELFMDAETNEYVRIEKKDGKDFKEKYGEMFAYVGKHRRKRVHINTVCPYLDLSLYDDPYFIDTDMYNLIPFHSIDYNNVKSRNNSLVYTLIDIQKNLNKREIQKSAYIDHGINAPVLMSYEDKDTAEDFEDRGNQPGMVLLYRSIKAPPRRMTPHNLGMEVWQDIADSKDKMNDISGVNETARGQSEYSNESGRLFAMKAERTGATINPYFRNLSKTRKMLAEYFLLTVKQVYGEDNRAVEISDRTHTTEEIVLNTFEGKNDIRQFEGRVILDEAEYSPTKLQENMQTKLVLAQMMPPELVNWEWILKDSELPDVEEQIEYIKAVLGIQAEQSAMEQAMAQEQAVSDQVANEQSAIAKSRQPARGGVNNGRA